MRSLKSGLLGCAIAGLLGAVAVVGCSADGASADLVDPAANGSPTEPSTQLPPSNPDGEEPAGDAGKKDSGKDSGKSDAAKDAGPPPPDEGAPCATPNQIFKRSCELCGTQEAVCLAGDDDGGAGKVSPYGQCTNQVANGCKPGSTEDIACGNCGTQKRTCNNYCAWTSTQCTGQPAQSCTPGSVELLSAGCDANAYRQKSCKANCTWDNVSATCTAPPSFVVVPPTAGSVSGTIATLASSKTMVRLNAFGTCPLTTWPSTTSPPPSTPYAYVEVRNTQPKAVKVSIYNSQAPGGPVIDTIMVAYDGTTGPTSESARKTCKGSVADYGTSALTGDSKFASLDDTDAVTIAPNSSIMVYFAAYTAFDAANAGNSTGPVKLNVKTESVAP